MEKQNIKNLIVAVDLSSYSKIVVRQAKELARGLNVPLSYVYVFEDIAIFDETIEFKKKHVTASYDKQIRKEYLLSEKDGVIIRYGRAYEEILALAKSYSRPMIVAGHKGNNPLVRIFVGSTAERLAQCSPFPLWIHRSSKIGFPKKILVPCDLSEKSTLTIEQANLFKLAFKAKIEIYHVMQEPTPILDFEAYSNIYQQIKKSDNRRLKMFKQEHPKLKTVRASGSVVDRIEDHAKAFDVMVLSPRNHNKSAALFGSITVKLIRSGDTPILVLP